MIPISLAEHTSGREMEVPLLSGNRRCFGGDPPICGCWLFDAFRSVLFPPAQASTSRSVGISSFCMELPPIFVTSARRRRRTRRRENWLST